LGVGLTVIVKLCGRPGHPFAKGVTIILAVIGLFVRLTVVNEGISPVPLAARPIEALSLVQLKPVPFTTLVKLIVLVAAPLHSVWLAGCNTLAVGFTVIVKLCVMPVQLFADGKTLIVDVIGALVKLVAVNEGIFPTPFAARPIAVLLLIQVKPVPLTVPVKLIALVEVPLHKAWLAGIETFGVGFTVMVNVCGAPGHPAADGVTVIVAVIGAFVELVAVNDGIFPLPVAASPIEVLLFVQLKVVPLTAPAKLTRLVDAPLHTV
jgi:hypothetical protein